MVTPQEFYRATNPTKALDPHDPTTAGYYIDFSEVRGGQIIEELRTAIAWAEATDYKCELFTGHIGCGKSTELLCLKEKLEADGFHVVYFVSDEDLDMGDAEITEILLAIARQVSESLEKDQSIKGKITDTLQGAKKLLLSDVLKVDVKGKIPGFGELGGSFDLSDEKTNTLSFSGLVGEISTTVRKNRDLRDRLREFLEPKSEKVIDVLNEGLFVPVGEKLREAGKAGLVVLVDNLDRLHSQRRDNGNAKTQAEYLFGDRGDELTRLKCHVVYTMPLALRYSNSYKLVKERFKTLAKVLPMVPVRQRDGSVNEVGLAHLKQMVLARAYPQLSAAERLTKIAEIFESEQTLNDLCDASGGHVRNLLRILNPWITLEKKFPLTHEGLKKILDRERNEDVQNISRDEWEMLKRIRLDHCDLGGSDDYEALIGNLSVYEYIDEQGSWYDVNPVLWEMPQLQ
jgi:hypothetical protein